MITAAELALLHDADPNATLPGIDTPTGNQTSPSSLKSLSSITTKGGAGVPFYYTAATNVVEITQAGTVLNGYNFGTATVEIKANDVTIENSTFSGTTGWYSVIQLAGVSGATIQNDTFNGGSAGHTLQLAAFIGAHENITISNNSFLNAPGDAVDIQGGTVTGNYFCGEGYSSIGTHPDAIWVSDSTSPTVISDNFIDWTWATGSTSLSSGEGNDCIRMTTEQGSVSDVTVSGNVLVGGASVIDAGNAGTKGTFSDINIDNNIIGFGSIHDIMPGPNTGVTTSGNTIIDWTNPSYSTDAWAAYGAGGIVTNNLVTATAAATGISGDATGSTTLYGDGDSGLHLFGTANETVFVGGFGQQYMWGGSGKNVFTYLSIADSTSQTGEDFVGNFDPTKDVIDLSHIDANLGVAGLQNFTFIGTAPLTSAGGQVDYVQNVALDETFVQVTLAGDTVPDLVIRVGGLLNLTAADFALTAAQSAADTAPAATVTAVKDSASSADLDAGKVVTLTLDFDKAVTVAGGAPTLTLNDGGTAVYKGGSGTSALTFTYTVAAGQNTSALAVTGVSLGGATIRDGEEENAVLTGATSTLSTALQIDTKTPTVTSVTATAASAVLDAYRTSTLTGVATAPSAVLDAGKAVTFTVGFSDSVVVSGGTPKLTLNDGGTATYVSGSGTSALTFSYIVAAGQNTSDLTTTGVSLNGATITDAAGNAAVLTSAATNPAGTLTIDTTAPTVTGVKATSAGADLDAGKAVTLTVGFSEAVEVAGGTPKLTLNDGGTATYVSGSGTSALTFSYIVAAGQNTSDLATTGVSLNGATIADAAGNTAVLTSAATNPAGALTIDTTAPTVTSVKATAAGADLDAGKAVTLTVGFSEAVTVSGGTPKLTLNDGGTASYVSGSGTNALTFSYVVAAGQITSDLTTTGVSLNGATIADAAGNAAVLTSAAANPAGTLTIDTAAPTVTSVKATAAGADLDAGKAVTLTVGFSEAVTVAGGTPKLTLNDGGTATYVSGSGTSALTFSYTVAAGQNTSDLTTTGVALGGATITDAAGNAAVLTGAVTNPAGTLTIDTAAPTVTSVKATAASAYLDAGKAVTLTVGFSEAVTVAGGTPKLTLNDGGTATYVGGSGTSALTFSYTVAAGENTSDLTTTGLSANGATIKDAAGNAAVLTAAATNPTGTLDIDTTAPTVTRVRASPGSGHEVTTGQMATITLSMSEAVAVTGAPVLLLNDGATAAYDKSLSTATAVVFDYTVGKQTTTGLAVAGVELTSGSSITDQAGNSAVLSNAAGSNSGGAGGSNTGLMVNATKWAADASNIGNFAVTGSSNVELFGASTANITFASGATGMLTLDNSQSFAGTVAGLASGDRIDLADIGYVAGESLSYKANSKATGGELTIGNGTHTANIALLGSYLASNFATSSDGHGGTLVTETPINSVAHPVLAHS